MFYPRLLLWTYVLIPTISLLLPTFIMAVARAQQQRAKVMTNALTARSRAAALARNHQRRYIPNNKYYSSSFAQRRPFRSKRESGTPMLNDFFSHESSLNENLQFKPPVIQDNTRQETNIAGEFAPRKSLKAKNQSDPDFRDNVGAMRTDDVWNKATNSANEPMIHEAFNQPDEAPPKFFKIINPNEPETPSIKGVSDIVPPIDEKHKEDRALFERSHWDQQEESMGQLQNMWNMNNFGNSPNEVVMKSMPESTPTEPVGESVGIPRLMGSRNYKNRDYYSGAFSGRNVYDDILEEPNPMPEEETSSFSEERVAYPEPTLKKLNKKSFGENHAPLLFPQNNHYSYAVQHIYEPYHSSYSRNTDIVEIHPNEQLEIFDIDAEDKRDESSDYMEQRSANPDPTIKLIKKKLKNKFSEPAHTYPQNYHSSYSSYQYNPYHRDAQGELVVRSPEEEMQSLIMEDHASNNMKLRSANPDPTLSLKKKKFKNKFSEPAHSYPQNYYSSYQYNPYHRDAQGELLVRSPEEEMQTLIMEDHASNNMELRSANPDPTLSLKKKKFKNKFSEPAHSYPQNYYSSYQYNPYHRDAQGELLVRSPEEEMQTLIMDDHAFNNMELRSANPDPIKKLKKHKNKNHQNSHSPHHYNPHHRGAEEELLVHNPEEGIQTLIMQPVDDKVGIPEPTFKKKKKKKFMEEKEPSFYYPQHQYNSYATENVYHYYYPYRRQSGVDDESPQFAPTRRARIMTRSVPPLEGRNADEDVGCEFDDDLLNKFESAAAHLPLPFLPQPYGGEYEQSDQYRTASEKPTNNMLNTQEAQSQTLRENPILPHMQIHPFKQPNDSEKETESTSNLEGDPEDNFPTSSPQEKSADPHHRGLTHTHTHFHSVTHGHSHQKGLSHLHGGGFDQANSKSFGNHYGSSGTPIFNNAGYGQASGHAHAHGIAQTNGGQSFGQGFNQNSASAHATSNTFNNGGISPLNTHGGQIYGNGIGTNSAAIAQAGTNAFNNGGFSQAGGHSTAQATSAGHGGQIYGNGIGTNSAAIAQAGTNAFNNGGFGQAGAHSTAQATSAGHGGEIYGNGIGTNAAAIAQAGTNAFNNGGFGQAGAQATATSSGANGGSFFGNSNAAIAQVGANTFQNAGYPRASDGAIDGEHQDESVHSDNIPNINLDVDLSKQRLSRSSDDSYSALGGLNLASKILHSSLGQAPINKPTKEVAPRDPEDVPDTMGLVSDIVHSSIKLGKDSTQDDRSFENEQNISPQAFDSITDIVNSGLRFKKQAEISRSSDDSHSALGGLDLASKILHSSLGQAHSLNKNTEEIATRDPEDVPKTMGFVSDIVHSSIKLGKDTTQNDRSFENQRNVSPQQFDSITDIVNSALRFKRQAENENNLNTLTGIAANRLLEGVEDTITEQEHTVRDVPQATTNAVKDTASSALQQPHIISQNNFDQAEQERKVQDVPQSSTNAVKDTASSALQQPHIISQNNFDQAEQERKVQDVPQSSTNAVKDSASSTLQQTQITTQNNFDQTVNNNQEFQKDMSMSTPVININGQTTELPEEPKTTTDLLESSTPETTSIQGTPHMFNTPAKEPTLGMINPDLLTSTPEATTEQWAANRDYKDNKEIHAVENDSIRNDPKNVLYNSDKDSTTDFKDNVHVNRTQENVKDTVIIEGAKNGLEGSGNNASSISSSENVSVLGVKAPEEMSNDTKIWRNDSSLEEKETIIDHVAPRLALNRNEAAMFSENSAVNVTTNEEIRRKEEADLIALANRLPFLFHEDGTRKNISELTLDEIEELQFDVPTNSTGYNETKQIENDGNEKILPISFLKSDSNNTYIKHIGNGSDDMVGMPLSETSRKLLSKSLNSSQLSIFNMTKTPFESIEDEMSVLTDEEKEEFIRQEVDLIAEVIEETLKKTNFGKSYLKQQAPNNTSSLREAQNNDTVLSAPHLFQVYERDNVHKEYDRSATQTENNIDSILGQQREKVESIKNTATDGKSATPAENNIDSILGQQKEKVESIKNTATDGESATPAENNIDSILGQQREKVESIKNTATDGDEDMLMISFIGDSVIKDLENRRNITEAMNTNNSVNTTNVNQTSSVDDSKLANRTQESAASRKKRETIVRASRAPLTQLITDPTTKLDVEKTFQNLGSIARHTFENPSLPMYHVRNMLGNTKDSVMSAAKMAPNNFLIPSKYEIAKMSRNREPNNEKVGAINPKMLLSRSGFGDNEDRIGAKLKASGNDLSGNSFGLDDTFQKIGGIVQESVSSGKDVVAHANDAALDAKKLLHSTRRVAPRLILPKQQPILGSRSLFPSTLGSPLPNTPAFGNRATLITPKIFDIQSNSLDEAQDLAEHPENFVGMGHLLDASGFSHPNQPKYELKKFVFDPIPFGNKKPLYVPNESTKLPKTKDLNWTVEDLKKPVVEPSILGSQQPADVDAPNSELSNDLEPLVVTTETLKGFMQRMHSEMKELVKNQYEERKKSRILKAKNPSNQYYKKPKDNKYYQKQVSKSSEGPILSSSPYVLEARKQFYDAMNNYNQMVQKSFSPNIMNRFSEADQSDSHSNIDEDNIANSGLYYGQLNPKFQPRSKIPLYKSVTPKTHQKLLRNSPNELEHPANIKKYYWGRSVDPVPSSDSITGLSGNHQNVLKQKFLRNSKNEDTEIFSLPETSSKMDSYQENLNVQPINSKMHLTPSTFTAKDSQGPQNVLNNLVNIETLAKDKKVAVHLPIPNLQPVSPMGLNSLEGQPHVPSSRTSLNSEPKEDSFSKDVDPVPSVSNNDDEKVELFLPPELMKPFMGQPSQTLMHDYLIENGDEEDIKTEATSIIESFTVKPLIAPLEVNALYPNLKPVAPLNLNSLLMQPQNPPTKPISYKSKPKKGLVDESIYSKDSLLKSPRTFGVPEPTEVDEKVDYLATEQIHPFKAQPSESAMKKSSAEEGTGITNDVKPVQPILPTNNLDTLTSTHGSTSERGTVKLESRLVDLDEPRGSVKKNNSDLEKEEKDFVELLPAPVTEYSKEPAQEQSRQILESDKPLKNYSNKDNEIMEAKMTPSNRVASTEPGTNISENTKNTSPQSLKDVPKSGGHLLDREDLGYVLGAINPMMFERHFNERLKIKDVETKNAPNKIEDGSKKQKDDSREVGKRVIKSHQGSASDTKMNESDQQVLGKNPAKQFLLSTSAEAKEQHEQSLPEPANNQEENISQQKTIQADQDNQIQNIANNSNSTRTSMKFMDPYKKPFLGYLTKDKIGKFLKKYNKEFSDDNEVKDEKPEKAYPEEHKEDDPFKQVVFQDLDDEADYNYGY